MAHLGSGAGMLGLRIDDGSRAVIARAGRPGFPGLVSSPLGTLALSRTALDWSHGRGDDPEECAVRAPEDGGGGGASGPDTRRGAARGGHEEGLDRPNSTSDAG